MQITEAQARLPFALASLGGLVAVWVLGWRMFGVVAGWLAAMLVAVDGYLIGFARIVQYQSIVFFMTVLMVLAIYRLAQTRRIDSRYLLLAALFLATGLLAHYEALWASDSGQLFAVGAGARRLMGSPGGCPTGRWDGAGAATRRALPAVVLVVILALFYVPFVLDVRFGRTYEDIVGNRIGSGFPYNNLADFFPSHGDLQFELLPALADHGHGAGPDWPLLPQPAALGGLGGKRRSCWAGWRSPSPMTSGYNSLGAIRVGSSSPRLCSSRWLGVA